MNQLTDRELVNLALNNNTLTFTRQQRHGLERRVTNALSKNAVVPYTPGLTATQNLVQPIDRNIVAQNVIPPIQPSQEGPQNYSIFAQANASLHFLSFNNLSKLF